MPILISFRRHFLLRRDAIVQQCSEWIDAARAEKPEEVSYDGLVASHNTVLSSQLGSARGAYLTALEAAVGELHAELQKLPALDALAPEADADDDDDDD